MGPVLEDGTALLQCINIRSLKGGHAIPKGVNMSPGYN